MYQTNLLIPMCLIKDYSMAVKVYESIIEKAPSLKAELCSGIGRLYLQVMYNCSQTSPFVLQ